MRSAQRLIRRRGTQLSVALLVLLTACLSACDWSSELGIGDNDDDTNDVTSPVEDTDIAGLSIAVSDSDFDTTRRALESAIAANYIFTDPVVDHRDNAADANLTLRPTRVYYVDDPNRSAALIAADARVALDLPARVLLYRDRDDAVGLAYDNANYLDARYDLDDAENGALDGFDEDLRTLVEDVAGNDLRREGSAAGIGEGEGIQEIDSDNDFNTTLNTLINAINANTNLTNSVTIDEAQRALATGRLINPSTLVIFGNPSVGSRLIQSSQTVGIDLPQKILITQDDDGAVHLYYNDPGYIADRHDIDDRDDQIEAIADLLQSLSDQAASAS